MKTIIMLILQLIAVSTVYPQIMKTMKEVIDSKGAISDSDFTEPDNDGFKLFYISYEKQMETVHSGKYTEIRVFYFTEKKQDALCVMWKIIEPSSEINTNVKFYNLHMVKKDNLTWKDYETGLIYSIVLKDGFCVTTCTIDI